MFYYSLYFTNNHLHYLNKGVNAPFFLFILCYNVIVRKGEQNEIFNIHEK